MTNDHIRSLAFILTNQQVNDEVLYTNPPKTAFKNKFNRYLFYALGEIILMVIGILIAYR